MAEHPFTQDIEEKLVAGVFALDELGYWSTSRDVAHVLDEQRLARAHREGKI